MKWVLVIVVVAVGAWMLMTRARVGQRPTSPPPPSPPAPPSSQATSQAMVVCAHCTVHLPQDEAFWAGSEPYCSEAHRKAHRRVGPRP